MENIKDVFAQVQKVAEKNNQMYKDIAEMSAQIAAKCTKNYAEIVLPVETELSHLLKDIRDTARFTKTPPFDDKVEELFLGPGVDEDKVSLELETTWRGVFVNYHYNSERAELWPNIHNATERSPSLTDTKMTLFSAWLASEEKANELAELIKKAYIPLLEWHKQQLEEVGSELSETIGELQGILSNSHTVEQNEDGTVEIQLGGKTYIGKVKEA